MQRGKSVLQSLSLGFAEPVLLQGSHNRPGKSRFAAVSVLHTSEKPATGRPWQVMYRKIIEKLQLVYHCEQVDIEHSDIMLDEQAAVYREVVAAVGRHYVPHTCFDFSAVID